MKKAAYWHSDLLGLPVRPADIESSIYELPMINGANVLLDDSRYRQGDDFNILFMFDTPDIDAAYDYLKENGVEIFIEIERHAGSVSFFPLKIPMAMS